MESNSIHNHTNDNRIGQPCSRSLICLSQVWLQSELDNTKSYLQLSIKITISNKQNHYCLLKYCHCSREKNSSFWRQPQFRSLYTISMVIGAKAVISWFILQLLMWLAFLTCSITNCLIKNCPITTRQVNKWKTGVFLTNQKLRKL